MPGTPHHIIYYQFASTVFKLEFEESKIDEYLDQLNILGVTFITSADFDESLVQDVVNDDGMKLSNYRLNKNRAIQALI